MSTKTSHYKAADKRRGFTPGELAGILGSHSPNASYRVLITFRGKVRELIVDDEVQDAPDHETVQGRDAGACLPPESPDYGRASDLDLQARSAHWPAEDQRHGGKVEATFHGTAATYPPGELTNEALIARFGDPRLSNLDRRDGLK